MGSLCAGGTVERWNGGTVERWNGGTVERAARDQSSVALFAQGDDQAGEHSLHVIGLIEQDTDGLGIAKAEANSDAKLKLHFRRRAEGLMQIGDKGAIPLSLTAFDDVGSDGNGSATDLGRQPKALSGWEGRCDQVSVDRQVFSRRHQSELRRISHAAVWPRPEDPAQSFHCTLNRSGAVGFPRSTVPPFHRSTVPPFHRSTVQRPANNASFDGVAAILFMSHSIADCGGIWLNPRRSVYTLSI
jgi:hypothetical protein